MNSRYKDKLVGVYAPSNYGHTSVLGQTQEFARWFWANREDAEYISRVLLVLMLTLLCKSLTLGKIRF